MTRLGWLVVLGLAGCGADAGPGGAMPLGVGLAGAGQAGAATEAPGGHDGGGAAGAAGRQTALRPGGAGGQESWPASGGLSGQPTGGGAGGQAHSPPVGGSASWCQTQGYVCGAWPEGSCGTCPVGQDCGVWGPGRCTICQHAADATTDLQLCGAQGSGWELWNYCGAVRVPPGCEGVPGEPTTVRCCPAGSVLP